MGVGKKAAGGRDRPRKVAAGFCGRCRHARRQGDKYCSQCGLRFDDAVAERKIVTLMFVDLCGSTALVSQADPEDAQFLLDRALRAMSEAVETYGGTVQRLQGDGIVALFGAPVALEDHALRACLAALAVQRRMREPGADGRRPQAQVRVGIHSGEVVVGSISDLLSSHHRLDGAAIHLAARLEQLATPGRVLVSAATARLVDGRLHLRSIGPHQIRGFEQPVELLELDPDDQSAPAGQASGSRHRTPLLGREDLLTNLQGLAGRVAQGRMCALGLRGEAGIGKSRLVLQLGKRLAAQGFGVCTMTTRSYTSHLPYSALADLMRALMGLGGSFDPQLEQEAARAVLTTWTGMGERHVPAAMDLLGLGEATPAWQALTPNQRRNRIGEALLWLIASRLSNGPLMIVIEDVFLADRDSLRTLEVLARKLDDLPVQLCCTYRREFAVRWPETVWSEEVWVQPLAPRDMQDLATSLLGSHTSLQALLPTLIERADGNPFYLEQMILHLADTGVLKGTPGSYRHVGGALAQSVPASIAAVISARVDRLPPAAKAMLEAMSVLNEVTNAGTLARMLDADEPAVDGCLQLCCDASLLQPARDEPEQMDASAGGRPVRFQHALVQEVVAAALTRPRRQQLHRAAFHALADRPGALVHELAAVLAHHAYHGALWPEAARFAHMAMARSVARSANRDALRILDTGLDATGRIEDGPTRLMTELALRSEALGALWPLGHFDAMFTHLSRAQAITAQLGDPKRQAAVAMQQAVLHWGRGHPGLGLEAAHAAQTAALKAGSRSAQMAAAQVELMLYHGLGRYRELVERAREIERNFVAELGAGRTMMGWATLPGINLQVFMADALARLGEESLAQQVCDAAYAGLRVNEHPFSRALLDFSQTSLWLRQGQHDRAARLLRQSHALCEQQDLPTMTPCIVGLLAEALGPIGQADEARQLVEQALKDKSYQIAGLYSEFFLRYGLGMALAASDQLDEAMEHLSVARAYAARYAQWGHEADALLAMGRVTARQGLVDQARNFLRAAHEGAVACGMAGVEQQARELAAALPERAASVGPTAA